MSGFENKLPLSDILKKITPESIVDFLGKQKKEEVTLQKEIREENSNLDILVNTFFSAEEMLRYYAIHAYGVRGKKLQEKYIDRGITKESMKTYLAVLKYKTAVDKVLKKIDRKSLVGKILREKTKDRIKGRNTFSDIKQSLNGKEDKGKHIKLTVDVYCSQFPLKLQTPIFETSTIGNNKNNAEQMVLDGNIEKILKKVDTNKDGQVDKNELRVAIENDKWLVSDIDKLSYITDNGSLVEQSFLKNLSELYLETNYKISKERKNQGVMYRENKEDQKINNFYLKIVGDNITWKYVYLEEARKRLKNLQKDYKKREEGTNLDDTWQSNLLSGFTIDKRYREGTYEEKENLYEEYKNKAEKWKNSYLNRYKVYLSKLSKAILSDGNKISVFGIQIWAKKKQKELLALENAYKKILNVEDKSVYYYFLNAQINDIRLSKDILSKILEYPTNTKAGTFRTGLEQTTVYDIMPFAGQQEKKRQAYRLRNIGDWLKKGNGLSLGIHPRIEKNFSDKELLAIENFIKDNPNTCIGSKALREVDSGLQTIASYDRGTMHNVGCSIGSMGGFLGEMGMMGPIFGALGFAGKGLSLTEKLGKTAAIAGITTVVNVPRRQNMKEERMKRVNALSLDENNEVKIASKEGEDWRTATRKSFGQLYIEMFTEQIGEEMLLGLKNLGMKAAKQTKSTEKAFIEGLMNRKIGQLMKTKGLSKSKAFQLMKKMFSSEIDLKNTVQRDGILGEYLEEFASSRLNAMRTGDRGTRNPFFRKGRDERETLLTVGIMGGALKISNTVVESVRGSVQQKITYLSNNEEKKIYIDSTTREDFKYTRFDKYGDMKDFIEKRKLTGEEADVMSYLILKSIKEYNSELSPVKKTAAFLKNFPRCTLSEKELSLIIENMHFSGQGEMGKNGKKACLYNYTFKQLLTKIRVGTDAGLTIEQASWLLREGYTGLIGKKGAKALDSLDKGDRISNLNLAIKMTKEDKNTKEIRKKTGREKGVEGKWRFEIENPGIIYNNKKSDLKDLETGIYMLGKLIKGSQLLKAFPKIGTVRVKIISDISEPGGSWNVNDNTIIVNKLSYDMYSIFIHELQHFLQKEEGFASGGSSHLILGLDMMKPIIRYMDHLNTLIKQNKSLSNQKWKYLQRELISILDGLENENSNLLDESFIFTDDIKQYFSGENLGELYGHIDELVAVLSIELYSRIGGEVEARNVEIRNKISPKERKNTPPSETESYAPKEQIILPVESTDVQESRFKNERKFTVINKVPEISKISILGDLLNGYSGVSDRTKQTFLGYLKEKINQPKLNQATKKQREVFYEANKDTDNLKAFQELAKKTQDRDRNSVFEEEWVNKPEKRNRSVEEEEKTFSSIASMKNFSIEIKGKSLDWSEFLLLGGNINERKKGKTKLIIEDMLSDKTSLEERYAVAEYLAITIEENIHRLFGDNRKDVIKKAHEENDIEEKIFILESALATKNRYISDEYHSIIKLLLRSGVCGNFRETIKSFFLRKGGGKKSGNTENATKDKSIENAPEATLKSIFLKINTKYPKYTISEKNMKDFFENKNPKYPLYSLSFQEIQQLDRYLRGKGIYIGKYAENIDVKSKKSTIEGKGYLTSLTVTRLKKIFPLLDLGQGVKDISPAFLSQYPLSFYAEKCKELNQKKERILEIMNLLKHHGTFLGNNVAIREKIQNDRDTYDERSTKEMYFKDITLMLYEDSPINRIIKNTTDVRNYMREIAKISESPKILHQTLVEIIKKTNQEQWNLWIELLIPKNLTKKKRAVVWEVHISNNLKESEKLFKLDAAGFTESERRVLMVWGVCGKL